MRLLRLLRSTLLAIGLAFGFGLFAAEQMPTCGLQTEFKATAPEAFLAPFSPPRSECRVQFTPVQPGLPIAQPRLLRASVQPALATQLSGGVRRRVPFEGASLPDVKVQVADVVPVFSAEDEIKGFDYVISNRDGRQIAAYVLQIGLYWDFRKEPVLLTHFYNAAWLRTGDAGTAEPRLEGALTTGMKAPGSRLLRMTARIDYLEFTDGQAYGPNELGFREGILLDRKSAEIVQRAIAASIRAGEPITTIARLLDRGPSPNSGLDETELNSQRNAYRLLRQFLSFAGEKAFRERMLAR